MKILFFLNSQKYPDFVRFVSDVLETIRCCICSEYLEKERITVTNPCSHFTCPECACELSRMWKNDSRKKKRCPMCRVSLLDNFFTKAFVCNMSKSDATSIFCMGTHRNPYKQKLQTKPDKQSNRGKPI